VTPGKPLVVTAGEPAGVGPELCNALADSDFRERIVVVGDRRQLDTRLQVIDTPYPVRVEPGRPSPDNAAALLAGLRVAASGCLNGEFAAMVTAPVAKSVIADSGVRFAGHTEFLASVTGTALPVMMLVAGELRVALATTHLPLREVVDALTPATLEQALRILHGDLQSKFAIADPEIAVCGVNPHAGEGGHLGDEESRIIRPVVDKLRAEGLKLRGPLPADTVFTPAAGRQDAILAMYHDQGLPALKYAGFGRAVNVTLGLPIIRTSVDHGTAFDIAGKGIADTGSMLAAVALAADLAKS
jgi:4-hydroxythreonine-4-phosphate dehydrogenase